MLIKYIQAIHEGFYVGHFLPMSLKDLEELENKMSLKENNIKLVFHNDFPYEDAEVNKPVKTVDEFIHIINKNLNNLEDKENELLNLSKKINQNKIFKINYSRSDQIIFGVDVPNLENSSVTLNKYSDDEYVVDIFFEETTQDDGATNFFISVRDVSEKDLEELFDEISNLYTNFKKSLNKIQRFGSVI